MSQCLYFTLTKSISWMIKPSQKQIRLLLVLLLLALDCFFGLKIVRSENNEIFPNCDIKRIDSFGEYHDKIFQIVANKMKLKINKNLSKPTILTDSQITPQRFNRYLGRKVENIFPYYFFKRNIIVIPLTCKLDSLVHELVHYFQVMYRNENLDFDCGPYIDNLELEALTIQRWFKSKYLNPYKLDHRFAVKFSHQVITFP